MLDLDAVATDLAISRAQVYALVRRGDLPAGKIGGRGQWRVRRADLEEYIERTWAATASWIADHPLSEGDDEVE
ncbi:helix-turn-helix domain-containing protein [Nocardioides aurantiacus]|nr:helix-turn-helix domain-containing protein [Nocardioides aurantiacus]